MRAAKKNNGNELNRVKVDSNQSTTTENGIAVETAAIIDPGATAEAAARAEAAATAEADRIVARMIGLVLDLAVGFGTLVVAGILAVLCLVLKLHIIPPLVAGLFFVAALVRSIGSRTNPWTEGFAIAMGAVFPSMLIAVVAARSGSLSLWGAALALPLVCGAGAQTQRFWKRRLPLASVATVVVLVSILFLAGKYVAPRLALPLGTRTMNRPAPEFTLTRLDGTRVTPDSLQGHVVLLDFWGTWCAPCLAEMPKIVNLHRQFASNQDVIFLAVNSGWQGDTPDVVRTFVQRKHLDIPVALDPENATGKLKIDGLPTLILIDRQGHIRLEQTGYNDGEPLETELTTQIEALLKPAN